MQAFWVLPEVEPVFVAGKVKLPGRYLLRDGDKMTVLQALAIAKGLESSVNASQITVVRITDSGARKLL
jgi:protein involved in polysaccharide export with SLBB domain